MFDVLSEDFQDRRARGGFEICRGQLNMTMLEVGLDGFCNEKVKSLKEKHWKI